VKDQIQIYSGVCALTGCVSRVGLLRIKIRITDPGYSELLQRAAAAQCNIPTSWIVNLLLQLVLDHNATTDTL